MTTSKRFCLLYDPLKWDFNPLSTSGSLLGHYMVSLSTSGPLLGHSVHVIKENANIHAVKLELF